MAQLKKKTTNTTVTITKPWQIAFIVTALLSQLIWVGMVLWAYTRPDHWIGGGTWTFQILSWFYALAYLLVAFVFIRRRIRGTLPRLFWSFFIATIGYLAYSTLSALASWARGNWIGYSSSTDTGLWAAYGWEWTVMIAVFVGYALTLCAVLWKAKK